MERMASWQISIQNESQAKSEKGLRQHFRHTVPQRVLKKLLPIPVGDPTPVLLYLFLVGSFLPVSVHSQSCEHVQPAPTH